VEVASGIDAIPLLGLYVGRWVETPAEEEKRGYSSNLRNMNMLT